MNATKIIPKKRKNLSTNTYKRFHKKFKKCQQCHKNFDKRKKISVTPDTLLIYLMDRLEIDHIKPPSEGGTNRQSNLIAICGECHYNKHSDEFNNNKKSFFYNRVKEYCRVHPQYGLKDLLNRLFGKTI